MIERLLREDRRIDREREDERRRAKRSFYRTRAACVKKEQGQRKSVERVVQSKPALVTFIACAWRNITIVGQPPVSVDDVTWKHRAARHDDYPDDESDDAEREQVVREIDP